VFEIMGLAVLALIVWQLWEIRTAQKEEELWPKKDED
jgi:lipopolysaccharide export system protein LptC